MGKISVKNLDLYYGDFKALKNINLEIEANKNYSVYRTEWMWKVHVIKVHQPHE